MTAGRALSVTLANQLTEIERLAHLVDGFCAEHGIPAEAAFHINLALDEVISNVIMHGYADVRAHEILVSLALEGAAVVVTVADDGRPFDPLSAPPVDFEADPLERPVGGLGLHLVRNVMDAIEDRYEDGRNVLVMRKTRP